MAIAEETSRNSDGAKESRLRRLVLALAALVLALLALGLIGGMWLYLAQTGRLGAREDLRAAVPDAEGMGPGAPVMMNGVTIGTVTRTTVTGSGAVLDVGLRGGARVPAGSRFLAASPLLDPPGGLRVLPPAGAAAHPGAVLGPQDGVQAGDSAPTPAAVVAQAQVLMAQMTQAGRQADRLMGDADRVTRRLGTTAQSVNALAADRRLRGDIAETLDNAQAASAGGAAVTRQMQQTLAASRPLLSNLTQAAAQVAAAARDVHTTTGAVSGLTVKTTQFLQSPPAVKTMAGVVKDLTATLGSLKSMSGHLDTLTAGGAKLAGDPQVQGDLRDTLHNLRDMTAKTNTLLDVLTKAAQATKH